MTVLRLVLFTLLFPLVISAITALASAAEACDTQEMQFFGIVKNVHQLRVSRGGNYCTFQVELSMTPMEPTPSTVCPLTPGEASGLVFRDYNCSKVEGQNINGVMVRSGNQAWIE